MKKYFFHIMVSSFLIVATGQISSSQKNNKYDGAKTIGNKCYKYVVPCPNLPAEDQEKKKSTTVWEMKIEKAEKLKVTVIGPESGKLEIPLETGNWDVKNYFIPKERSSNEKFKVWEMKTDLDSKAKAMHIIPEPPEQGSKGCWIEVTCDEDKKKVEKWIKNEFEKH